MKLPNNALYLNAILLMFDCARQSPELEKKYNKKGLKK